MTWKQIVQAADPTWRGNRSGVVDAVEEILWEMRQPQFRPGENEEFWLSEQGQIIASALYLSLQHELITPVEAGRIVYGSTPYASKYAVDLAKAGKLHAYPRPEWTKDVSAEHHRAKRGHVRKVFWLARRSEAEELARERMAQPA